MILNRILRIFPAVAMLALPAAAERCAYLQARGDYADRAAEGQNLAGQLDGWEFDFFDNRQLDRLAAGLPGYDMVILGSLGNLIEPASFLPWRDEWRRYLENGGTAVVLTACEATAHEEFLRAAVDDPGAASGICALLGRFDLNTRIRHEDAEVLRRPHDLEKGFTENGFFHWGHLALSPDWETLVHCPEGESLMAMRQVGDGWIFMITHPEYSHRTALLKSIVENIRIFTLNRRAGVSWTEWHDDADQPEMEAVFVNMSENPATFAGRLSLAGPDGEISECVFDAEAASGETVPVTLASALPPESEGLLTLRLERPASWQVQYPVFRAAPLEIELPFRRLFRHQKDVHKVGTRITPPAGAAGPFEVAFTVEPEAPVRLAARDETSLTLDWSACAPGEYRLGFTLLDAGGATVYAAPAETVVIDERLPFNRVDERHRIVRGDRRIFPLGFYHVSWNLPPENRLECMDFSAACGYNTLHASWIPGEDLAPVVEAARERGLLLFMEGAKPETLPAWRDETGSIIGWSLRDEPDLALVPPEELFEAYETWREAAPDHLISTVLVYPTSFQAYGRVADWIGHDYYPVIAGSGRDISQVFENHSRLRREVGDWRAPLAVLQCFGYDAGFIKPTPEELRNMIYQALLADTSGILFYTYDDSIFALKNSPELHELMRRIPAEIAAIEEFLLDASPVLLDSGSEAVIAGRWTLGNRHLEIACNVGAVPVACAYGDFDPLEVKIRQWEGDI